MSEMIDGYTANKIKESLGKFYTGQTVSIEKDLKHSIQIHRLIGEMKGSVEMMLSLYREHMNENQISSLEDLLKRYDEFFKDRLQ